MNPVDPAAAPEPPATEDRIPELVGAVYALAPAPERGRMIEHLLRPLGVLSLVAVAGGIFAKIRFRSGWQDMHVRLDDLLNVKPGDVVALADHAQQVSVETVDSLAQMLAASPMLAGTAAAVLLATLLIQRSRRRGPG
ncbi:MAG: hypothetical protein KGL43_00815 [Burkholderiales bacterium]|nr:hypothetical protein [Burkholderiales bacterium]